MRMRLDAALVKRGLAESRSHAARMIDERNITVGGVIAEKTSRMVAPEEPIEVLVKRRFVSRGGEKLEHALDKFGISVENRSVLDAGVSTGGFTDCVLQRGARRVFAVDVGRNQLHEHMKSDPRVDWRDGVNVRDLVAEDCPYPCSLVVADLSFISLTKVLPAFFDSVSQEVGFETPGMVLLVKPQFEAGRIEVSRGKGVITDPGIHQEACDTVRDAVLGLGGSVIGVIESPIKGAEGNTEFLMYVECSTRYVSCES
ncbi:MAG: TlyA family RNA methyltransferase [Ilumatobacteraceae bacterium]|jgi:23S rRNA (cytidine1920-2'-O)/16S rRNA (cytidine1409-2'-O)-methyltransferase